MKLMTKEIERKLPPMYSTDGDDTRKVVVKYFTPDSNWTWYVFEGEKTEDGDYEFYGLVDGFEKALGYFTLGELEGARGPMGLPIERDLYYTGETYKELMR